MKLTIDSVKPKMLPILKDAGVLSASLFGSVARGENKIDSDIDILVEFPRGKTLFDLVDLKMKLEEALQVKVDVATPRSLSPKIKPFVQNDLVTIL